MSAFPPNRALSAIGLSIIAARSLMTRAIFGG
jgi:hypothetical protein